MVAHGVRRWIDGYLNREARKDRARAAGSRPRLEALEDRTLLTAGPLDPTFGNGGVVQTNLPFDSDIILTRSVEQPDGKIVAAGTVSGLYGRNLALERFNADGSLDTSFGNGGQVDTPLLDNFTDYQVGLALQADGKIVVAASSLGEFITLRYNADGSMDGSFGNGGYVLTAFGGGAAADAVAVQADGKIVVAGDDNINGGFGLVRYNADGSLDLTFGNGGKAAAAGRLGSPSDVALQADGKIVLAGVIAPQFPIFGFGQAYTETVGLARYNVDGSIDAGFGSGGVAATPLTIVVPGISDVFVLRPAGRPVSEAVGPDGKIVVADSNTGGVARLNTDGSLDAGFGNGGVITVTANGSNTPVAVEAVRIDAEGRVVVGGRFFSGPFLNADTWLAARYTADGHPDDTFGSGGQVTNTFFTGNSDAEVTDLVLDADGDVTAVGVGRRSFDSSTFEPAVTSAALARYDADGAPEASFGTNGQELVNFEGPSVGVAAGVVVQPDGKVVVAMDLGATSGEGIDGEHELALVRYNADGSLDTTFGDGGAARLAIGAAGTIFALARQADGKIVVDVESLFNGSSSSRLVRFNADGSLDTGFGDNGMVTLDFAGNALTVDANGDILVAGGKAGTFSTDQVYIVARFLPNGSPDASFGGSGEVTTAFNQAWANDHAILVQPDGKIVVAGAVRPDTTTSSGVDTFIALVRYNPDGSLDGSFGRSGIVTTAIGSDSAASSMALEPDGRIVVGGDAQPNGGPYFLLVRYNTDGSLDTTFAQGGFAFSTDFSTVQGVAVQPDGTIVALTTPWAGAGGLAVVSYAPDGRRDVTFTDPGPAASAAGVAVGPDGKVVIAGWFGASGASDTVVERFLNEPPPPPVFVVGTDGSLLAENYISPGWATLSPAGTILSVSGVTDAGGGTDVFAIAADHSLWERTVNGWVEISSGSFQQISATTDAAGHAVVFGVLGPGAGLYHNTLWEYHDGAWLWWQRPMFPDGGTFLTPSFAQYVSAVHTAQGEAAYIISAFGRDLYEYTSWGGWLTVSTGSFVQVSAGLNSSGQAVVYGVVSDGSVWEQNPAFGSVGLNTGWRVLHSTDRAEPASFLSVAAGGPDEVFAIAADHSLWAYSSFGWTELSARSFANISARRTASGADEVFGTLTDGSFWEYTAGGGAGPTWRELLPGGVASSSAP